MIKTSDWQVFNIEGAMRGMRNPMNSWAKGDTKGSHIGPNDLNLLLRLTKAGTDHRKALRQILVSLDITAPLYWWKEFDTYKVGTVSNSTSTMHKIHSKSFAVEDFSTDQLNESGMDCLVRIIDELEELRTKFIETKDKEYWQSIIQLLPSSYNQTRTITLNYEVLLNMYFSRRNHKLIEWRTFCEEIFELSYMSEIIGAVKVR